MLRSKSLFAGVAAAAIALSGASYAAPVVWGGGSTLAGPYYQTVFALLNAATPTATFGATGATLNPVDPTNSQLGYAELGSGTGRSQFETNVPNTSHSGNLEVAGDDIAYGASDAFISASDLTAYAPLEPTDGPMIQVPTLGVPVTVAYDFTPNLKAGKTSPFAATLKMTDADLCKIYSDPNPTWLDVASVDKVYLANKALFQAVPFGPLSVVVRSDSSGTTFLFTQHLAAVCPSSTSSSAWNWAGTNSGAGGAISTWPADGTTASAPFTGTTPNFVGENGNGGEAIFMTTGGTAGAAPANAIAYISPDYTSIAPKSGHSTSLPVASLVNATNGTAYQPSAANTSLGLTNPGSSATHLGAPSTFATAEVQTNWVPSIATPTEGYPIVGYTNMIFAQCYANNNVATELRTFLKDQYNGTYATQIANAGFVAVPKAFVTEIDRTFITNTNAYSPSLTMQAATVCKHATGATSKASFIGR
jgi:ABC-type phosphate transport system substrate-binding protein